MHPIVGVGAVVVKDGRVLIVKRAHAPLAGTWTIPGGRVEFGERLEDAVQREVREETGLDVVVGPVVEVFDRIERRNGRIAHHFVIVDFACAWRGGTLVAADDALDATWVAPDDLARYGVSEHAAAVIRRGLEMVEGGAGGI